MRIISKFINYSLQEQLIELIASEKIYHRVKADRSLETAMKWKQTIYDLCVDISFEYFEQPVLFDFGPPIKYDEYILKLAKHNIPFFTFVIDNEYTIITSHSDSDYICEFIGYSQKRFEN